VRDFPTNITVGMGNNQNQAQNKILPSFLFMVWSAVVVKGYAKSFTLCHLLKLKTVSVIYEFGKFKTTTFGQKV
jgi:hypothetical protein